MSSNKKIIKVCDALATSGFLSRGSAAYKWLVDKDHDELQKLLQKILEDKDVAVFTGVKQTECGINAEGLKAIMKREGLTARDLVPTWPWKEVCAGALLVAVLLGGLLWLTQAPDPALAQVMQELHKLKAELVETQAEVNRTRTEVLQECLIKGEKELQSLRKGNAMAEIHRDEIVKAKITLIEAENERLVETLSGRIQVEARGNDSSVVRRIEQRADKAAALTEQVEMEARGNISSVVRRIEQDADAAMCALNQTMRNAEATVRAQVEEAILTHANYTAALDEAKDALGGVKDDTKDFEDRLQKAETFLEKLEDRNSAVAGQTSAFEESLARLTAVRDDVFRQLDDLRGEVWQVYQNLRDFNEMGGPYTLFVVIVAVTCVVMGAWAYQAVTRAQIEYKYCEEFTQLEPSSAEWYRRFKKHMDNLEKKKAAAQTCSGFLPAIPMTIVVQYCFAMFVVFVTFSCMYVFSQGLSTLMSPVAWVGRVLAWVGGRIFGA